MTSVVLVFLVLKVNEDFHLFVKISFGDLSLWIPFISSMFILAVLNLGLETKKWTSLTRDLDLFTAWKAVLKGMAAGFITPNRIGELPTRILVVPFEQRTGAAAAAAVGSFLQGVITFGLGIISLMVFPAIFDFRAFAFDFSGWIWSAVIGAVFLAFGYLFRKKILNHVKCGWQHIQSLKPFQLFYGALYAFLRYLVFSLQLAIALYIFGFDGNIIVVLTGIPALFFIQSYLPFSTFGELGLRELLAVVIFGSFMPQPWLAALATLSLWIFNLLLPILVSLFVQLPVTAKQTDVS
jgi:hypothetical protein